MDSSRGQRIATLSAEQRHAWLRLARTEQVGPATFAGLIARFGSAAAALEELPRLTQRSGGKTFRPPAESDVTHELGALAALGGRLIASCEPDFPQTLAALDPPPPVIALLGDAKLLEREMVAIVGARNASALARKFAQMLARDLTDAGLVVVSGLARGIDSAAHEAALDGGTIAVVAGGLDIVYPPENEALYRRICAQGTVVSEMRLGEAPQARHFPRRNRIISGLARGVIVVEAAERSGSLITANYALEQGREIFAVPGSPLDPRARGANRLLRDGATLTESAEDVLAVLRPILGRNSPEAPARTMPPARNIPTQAALPSAEDSSRVRAAIANALGPAPVAVDELIRQIGAPAALVMAVLLDMELSGDCIRLPGNLVGWV